MLHHAGDEENELQLRILNGSFLKGDDYIDTEYEQQLAAGPAAASPLTSIPILHSLPGSVAAIYLDFDGHFEAVWGSYSNITTPVFDIDGDASTFSDTELTRITNIWKRVAEDFAPFQIDVTTEDPGDFSNGHGLRVSIGGGGAWLGSPAGGVAYIGNFLSSVPNTVYVFSDALGKNEKSIAEASSHEAGHAFGLQHQSLYDANGIKTAEYNPGGAGWAPIMGVSYYQALSTWHDGASSLGPTTLQDDLAVISKPENGFGYRGDDHAESAGSATPLALTGNTLSGSGIIEYMTDVDAFSFATDAGSITLGANVAALGPNLDAIIELRDSGGTLIASAAPAGDLNATIATSVIAGDYTLLVMSSGDYGRIGQYTITGTINAGLFVIDHTPAEGSVVTSLATDFELQFSEPIDTSGVSAAALLVNGIAADSVSIVDSETLIFHFLSSPITSEGVQQMTMAAGAVVTLADGSPLNAFSGTFRYDALPLAVTATMPPAGATVTLPLTVLAFDFNEPYDPASVTPSDLVLSQGQVTGVTFSDADSLAFTISGVQSEGSLNYSLEAGALVDVYGNPSLAYAGSAELDFDTTAFPLPLGPIEPLGSQVFDPPVAASIGLAGDTDSFTIELPAGAKLSVVVDPAATLRPTVELLAPGDVLIASNSAAAAGQDAVVQSAAIAANGSYTVRVGSAGGTGAYTLELVLNAAVEAEAHDGPDNTTPGSAQDLDGALVDLGGGIDQAALLGVTDPPNDSLPSESEPNNSTATANLASHNFDEPPADRYQLGLTGAIGSSGDYDWYRLGTMNAGDVITVTMSGTGASRGTLADSTVDLYRAGSTSPVLVASNDDSGPSLDSLIYRFTVSVNDTYLIRARAHSSGTGTYQVGVFLENSGAAPATGGGITTETESNNTALTATNVASSWRAVQYASSTSGSITTGDADYFAYDFQAGDLVTLWVDATSGSLDATVALLNSSGNVIAAEDGTRSGPSPDSPLYGYIIPTTGTYYVRTMGSAGTGNYTLSAYLSSATAPEPPTERGDYYTLSLDAGQSVWLSLRALDEGSVTLAVTDALGNVIAPGVAGSTNLDQYVAGFVAPLADVYHVRVDGDPDVPYSLVATRGAAFDREANNDAEGALVGLDGQLGAVGHLDANPPTWFGQWDLTIDPLQASVTLTGSFAGVPLLEQLPGSLTAHYQGTLLVNRQPTYVQFPSGSVGDAIAQPGPFLPGNTSADYAGTLELFPGVNASGVFTNVTFDVNSALLGPVGPVADPSGPTPATFPANSVILTFTSGLFSYDIPGLLSGSQSIAGLSEINRYEGLATLDEIDGVLYLTLPVLVETTVIEPTTQLPFTAVLQGEIVATRALPGPIDEVDWYDVELALGEKLVLATATPLDDSSLTPANSLDPELQVLNPSGVVVAQDDNSAADGKNASLIYAATAPGRYRIGVRAGSGAGAYVLSSGVEPPDPAPRVVKVSVRGADGSQPWYDVPAGSGDQIRSVPVGRVDQIAVAFSTTVDVDQFDLTLTGAGDGPPYTFADFEYLPATNTAVWTLSNSLDTDQLLLSLNADGPDPITNLVGEALDGEWTNPATIDDPTSSVFPSGNGVAGGDFAFDFTVHPGDANQDNVVDGADYTIWSDHYLQAGGLATIGDFTTDGVVDGADYTVWADRYQPQPAATAPLAADAILFRSLAAETDIRRATGRHAGPVSASANDNHNRRHAIVDRLMRELALAAVRCETNGEDLVGVIARARGRFDRGSR